MRIFLATLALLIGVGTAQAANPVYRKAVIAASALTATAPTGTTPNPLTASKTSPPSVLLLEGLTNYRITVCADGGNMTAYVLEVFYFSTEVGAWSANGDMIFSKTKTSQCLTVADVPLPYSTGGYMTVRSNGSTVSAGTTITITIEGFGSR